MNTKSLAFIGLLSLSLFTSCGFKGAEEEATTKINSLYETRIKNGGLFQEDDYNFKYWRQLPKENWEQLSQYLNTSHGKLKEFKILEVQSKVRKKGLSSAGWVAFKIETQYEKGLKGMEQVNLYRNGKGESFYVERHFIQSSLLDETLKAQQN